MSRKGRKMPLRLADSVIKPMWEEYSAGASLYALARKYGKERRCIRQIFERRGLKVREVGYEIQRQANGCFLGAPKKTKREIDEMVATARRVEVPEDLKREWRLWGTNRRMDFINRVRKRFPNNLPTGPYSANVEYFDYGTPRAREIVARMNQGRNSRTKRAQLKPVCQGVIYKGRLFFWSRHRHRETLGEGYFVGVWRKGIGRPSLHHIIWEEANGRKVPPSFTVIHADGNKNNLDPSNLKLRHRGECARLNKCGYNMRQSRASAATLLRKHQEKRNGNEHVNLVQRLVKSARPTARRGYSAARTATERTATAAV